MTNTKGRTVTPGDVMYTVSKLARMSKQSDELSFDGDIGKIKANPKTGAAVFDLGVEDAKKLVEFSKDIDAGGAQFKILHELELDRDSSFGVLNREGSGGRGGRGGFRGSRDGDRRSSYNSGSYRGGRSGAFGGGRGRGGYRRDTRSYHDNRHRGDGIREQNTRGSNSMNDGW
jgi:hypothetical protein